MDAIKTIQTMTPVGKQKLLVSVNMEQKQQAEIGGKLLYLGVDWNWSGIERNPVLARVLSVSADIKDIQANDWVLCSHHAFDQVQRISDTKEVLRDDTGEMENGERQFVIGYWAFEGKVVDGEVIPRKDKMIVEPIFMLPRSEVLFDPTVRTYETRFRVITKGDECEDVNNGDVIECYRHSNYSIVYTWRGIRKMVMIIDYRDMFAIWDSLAEHDYRPEIVAI